MIKYLLVILFTFNMSIQAQELFVVTEPASNMPSKSIGIRAANYFMKEEVTNITSYHFMPEIMFGLSNKIMVHAALISSNREGKMNIEGVTLYGKYRLLSVDDVHKHFRMAAFGRWSTNNSPIHMHENSLLMHNSGYEYGVVGTQLLHKTAISSTLSLQRAISTSKNKFPYTGLNNSLNYSLSFGQLLLPKTYTSYKQTNMNVMLEFVGQHNVGNNKGFLDAIPSLQFIFNSVARLDIGYRKKLTGDLFRSYNQGFIIKLEYIFFNALK